MKLILITSIFFSAVGVFVTNALVNNGHSEHEELSRYKITDEIAEHLTGNLTVFAFHHIKQLLTKLRFENCIKVHNNSRCNLCMTPEAFIKWYGYSETNQISKEEIKDLSIGLLYLLSEHNISKVNSNKHSKNISAVCKTFTTRILRIVPNNGSSELYNLYLSKYGKGEKLTEESIELILGNINKTIGYQLTNTKKCFTPDDVLKGANVSASGFGKHDLQYVSAYIILKLMKKTCIGHEVHEVVKTVLPTKTFFVDTLFKEFGNGVNLTHEGFEKLYYTLLPAANGTVKAVTNAHSGHNHRKKRSIEQSNVINSLERTRRSIATTPTPKKCLTAENILQIFSIPEGSVLTKTKFQEVCPSIIQMLESKSCSNNKKAVTPIKADHRKNWEPWVGAMVSIAIISFGSLICALVFPGKNKKWFPYVIMFLIALGVSVLVCDAMLHLIPHSLGLHQHKEEAGGGGGDGGHEDPFKSTSFLWKSMLVLAGIYAFFLFEVIMHSTGSAHSHSHHIPEPAHDHSHSNGIPSPVSSDALKKVHVDDAVNYEDVIANDYTAKYKNGVVGTGVDNGEVVIMNGTVHKEKQKFHIRQMKSIAWMILIGDGIHNFMDGVAIGVAFSEPFPDGLHGGVSTSIAILCHEVPHELGDFAILIASGLTIKQAIICNIISSLSAFVGGILGVSLGTSWNAGPWIFAITGGLFIYIALVDMLPELMNSPMLKRHPFRCICNQVSGMLIGVVIMFALAGWEEQIKNALK